jgi:hypothetical protein
MDRSFLDPSLDFYVSEELRYSFLEGALLTSTTIIILDGACLIFNFCTIQVFHYGSIADDFS